MGAEVFFVTAVVLGITLLSALGFLILNFTVDPYQLQEPSPAEAHDKRRPDSYPPFLWR